MLAGWRHDRVLKGSLCNGERRQSAHASYYVPVPKRLKVMHSPDDSHGRYTVDRWRVMSPMTPYRWRRFASRMDWSASAELAATWPVTAPTGAGARRSRPAARPRGGTGSDYGFVVDSVKVTVRL